MNRKGNYLNIIGLSQRAGKNISGIDLIVEQIQRKHVSLLLIAQDCSQATKKKLIDKCRSYDVPFFEVEDRYTLGKAIGKEERVAVAIIDKGFASKIQSLLEK